MDKIELFKSLFPLPAIVTKDILKKANKYNWENCIGVLTLEETLGEYLKILKLPPGRRNIVCWANKTGFVCVQGEKIYITTKEKVEMMKVIEPRSITFIMGSSIKVDYDK